MPVVGLHKTQHIPLLPGSLSPEPNKREGNDQELLLKWCKDMLKTILPYLPVTGIPGIFHVNFEHQLCELGGGAIYIIS